MTIAAQTDRQLFAEPIGPADIRYIHAVADYGQTGDLAFAEVKSALWQEFQGATINAVSITPFDTVKNAFALAQLALGRNDVTGEYNIPAGTLIFHNVAPRKDDHAPRRGNRGEEFLVGRLTGHDVFIAGPSSGHSWSLLADSGLVDIRVVPIDVVKSQFRSRDNFPRLTVKGLEAFDSLESAPRSLIAPLPPMQVGYVDGYGNIKLTSGPARGVEPGTEIVIEVASPKYDKRGMAIPDEARSRVVRGTVAGGSFESREGDLVWSSGSSNFGLEKAGELFLRGGNAAKALGIKKVGGEYPSGAAVSVFDAHSGRAIVGEPLTGSQTLSSAQAFDTVTSLHH